MLTAAVLVWLAALSGYDLACRRLPNWLTLPGVAAVLVVAAGAGRGLPAVLGAAGLAGVYLTVYLVAPTAMGAGDVKLALGAGALTGCYGAGIWLLAALAAPLLTAVVGLAAALRGVRAVPHGPSMCLASAGAVALAAI